MNVLWESDPLRAVSLSRLSQDKSIFVITMNHNQNYLTSLHMLRLMEALDKVENIVAEDESPVVIFTSGARCFSAGIDIEEAIENPKLWADFYFRLLIRILNCPYACIAAIHGHAIAAGLVFAFSMDFRLSTSAGFMWMNEVNFGIPEGIQYQAIMRGLRIVAEHSIGQQECRRLVLLGEKVSGQEQVKRALVHSQLPDKDLMLKEAIALASSISNSAHGAFTFLKRGLNEELIRELEILRQDMRPSQRSSRLDRRSIAKM